ncbi:MAG: hypothetical protein KBA81_06595 [Rhabdochlamydiaceae bacterium]|nr:hypothetical protein [Rhabdochlamydiaceae bacterium]MBP9773111.1 hypothetical protein [Candidatus Peribacteraceae bacterium]
MIDTILLKIPHGKFAVTLYDKFQPNARGFFLEPFLPFTGQPFIKAVNNPTKLNLRNGVYRPRLTLYKRYGKIHGSFPISLHIELSLPKLLYHNNFDELKDADFETIITILKRQLLLMGVIISKDNLRTAEVHAVHYSKNIVFNDGTTASMILGYLQKIKLTKRLDMNATDFRNQGEAVRYYAKSHEFVFYDKVADLSKSKDRAMEKKDREWNPQMDMFDAIRRQDRPIEVLRMELRLKSRKKIKLTFEGTKDQNEMAFQSMFSEQLSQKLLQEYWSIIYDELRPILLQELNSLERFVLIQKQRCQWQPQRILAMVGICEMVKTDGHRKTRNCLAKSFHDRTFARIYKDIKELDFKILNKAKPFEHVNKVLKDFVALKKECFNLNV